MSAKPLTENQTVVLLQFGSESGWLRPLDLGGRDGSNHSAVLAQLIRRGLVESKVRSFGDRGSKLYRITPAGRSILEERKAGRQNSQFRTNREGFKVMTRNGEFMGGKSIEARSAEGAAAIVAAIGGVTVAEAYERQGVPLPLVGTQVADPVPADALQAGDVGMRAGDFVMALGGGEALVSGQVQSVESVSTGPGFLGWFDPTKPNRPQ